MARRSASPTRDRSRSSARGRSTSGRQPLHSRILSRVLVISIAPMLFIGMIAFATLIGLAQSAERNVEASHEELTQDVAGRTVRTAATGAAREVERLLAERMADVIDLSVSPLLVSAANEAAVTVGDGLAATPTTELEQAYAGPRRLERGSDAERHLRVIAKRQSVFRQLLFTERNGFTVGSSSKPPQFSNSETTWWSTAWNDGFYLGPVERFGARGHGLTVAARIGEQGTDEAAGVLRAVINLRVLQQTVDRIAQDSGSDVTLLTSDGMLLAETVSDHDVSRMLNSEIELDDERAATVERALASTDPGFVLTDTAVAGFAPLSSVDGRLRRLLQRFDSLDQPPIQWVAVVEQPRDAVFAPLDGLTEVSEGLSETARTFGIIVLVALVAALAAAFLVSRRLAQRIVGPLRSLGATARTIADDRLPALVHRAQTPVDDRDTDLPMLPAVELTTNDEIEDVADAFNIVSSTAADLAADQARSRRNVARMFVSLGRRNQNLLSRQLEFIDRLERDTSDPDLLDDLFRLDHLATRMRRNAESLLVLAGEQPARRWSEPVSLTDVVRGAISEIEDYRRVTLDGVEESQLAGAAVGDVSHLLAELIENAAQFSPPDTPVEIVGRRVVDGYALAVVDDGVGMGAEQLEDANRRIDASPMVDRVPSSFLGLFVVGRLAARHGIGVRLVESTTQGVTAKVLFPSALIDPPVPTGVAGDRDGGHTAVAAGATAASDGADRGGLTEVSTASAADRQDLWVDVTDDDAADSSRVSASMVRDRDAAFDQTVPPIPGRRGRSWSSRERTSTYRGAPFDEIEVRGLRDEDIDLREPVPDAGAPDAEDPAEVVDEHAPDRADAAAAPEDSVDLGVDQRDPAVVRDDRRRTAEDDWDEWSEDDGFEDLTYAGGVRYPSVADTAPEPAEPDPAVAEGAADEEGPDGVAGDGVRDDVWARDDAGDAVRDDVWARDDAGVTAADATVDDVWVPGHAPADGLALDEPGADVAPAVDDRPAADDRPPGDTAPAEVPAPDEPDAGPVLEVRRRASQRPGAADAQANGRPPAGRALLRSERPASDDDAPSEVAQRPVPSRATASAEVTDDHGVTLTAAERDARAARDRLSRFQQAVQQGRSQTRSRRNGGEHHDA